MHLVLFPKTANLAVGVGIGLAIAAVGRWLVVSEDNTAIMPVIGALAVLGGVWVAASCAFRIWRPRPSFAADEEGFSVLGKRKQPWEKFQGVGVQGLKQGGITTNKWVYVKVGKGPVFARKQHIKWTHLSDDASSMAEQIFAFAQKQAVAKQMKGLIAEAAGAEAVADATRQAREEQAAAGKFVTPPPMEPIKMQRPTADTRQAPAKSPKRAAADFSDGPIKSGGGGLRGLFGG